ncbi:MAG TPA: putative glycolipid-binding domain-containing protein [Acidimicrobiales bacterium]|nr:putative glycolipid-binding domain-containing protein [Acidimicrobiales bacterium]
MAVRRLLLWSGIDAWRAEVATLELGPDSVAATGTQLGVDPLPYRLDYTLTTGPAFVTGELHVEVAGEGWGRRLRLGRHAGGTWSCQTEEHGDAPLPPSGGDVAAVRGARDCDLALSPLTNLMPVRRHRLHERQGEADLLMAWVSVPDLGLHRSEQRYEHVRRDDDHAVVRYVGRDDGFVAELVLDRDGVVERYPDLAERVAAG